MECGAVFGGDVHHIDGNHKNNDLANLIRLCRGCHLRKHRTRTFCALCGRPAKGRGLCSMHYQRLRKTGAAGLPEKNINRRGSEPPPTDVPDRL